MPSGEYPAFHGPYERGPETVNNPIRTQLDPGDLSDVRDILYALDQMSGEFTGNISVNGKSVKVDFDTESHSHVMVI